MNNIHHNFFYLPHIKTPANGIFTPFTRVSSFKITRQTSPYAFICFANFPFSLSRSHIPGTMYFTGFAVIFDCSKTAAFQPYPPNFILGENSFCFLKFPISDFSNLGDNYFPFEGIFWRGGKVLPPPKFLSLLPTISLHNRTLKCLHHGWRQFLTILIEVNWTFFRLFNLFQLFFRRFLSTLNN